MDPEPQNSDNSDSTFVWDQNSQLYFHASSGFYHDPNAGWYYSTKDGVYYKFEDGNYVPLDCNKDDDVEEIYVCKETKPERTQQIQDINNEEDCSSFLGNEIELNQQIGTLAEEAGDDAMNSTNSPTCGNPPPPSEWLEDTLIDLYLSGYNNIAVSAADTVTDPVETNGYNFTLEADAYSNACEMGGDWTKGPADENGMTNNERTVDQIVAYSDAYEVEEGEWIPDPEDENHLADGSSIEEGILFEEEKWRAQYGQVNESRKDLVLEFPVVDLWDWEMVRASKKDGKNTVARLVGRLVKQSAKRHPSISSVEKKFRSAPICEVHLDLVRVKTGQVYRLRNPSARCVASLSSYDSADPTKDWDFPQLSSNTNSTHVCKSSQSTPSTSTEIPAEKDLPTLPSQLSASKQIKCQYRDRAAERRILHGGFGVGPGQKNLGFGDDTTSSLDACPEEATEEALKMSFGPGSYARNLLEGMGWKEGEGLGSSTKGLVEPIQPVGNIGSAGLGWPRR